ncbi:L-type lectin-domain containing receptor kinase S.4-like [Tasmannia lanceolata]|uniref:L-type lectin-domain containing receptor kinase S.4-like n=1 Tax=Tasmannia lanceolata TaxID=3420 RepID=UPI00406291A9
MTQESIWITYQARIRIKAKNNDNPVVDFHHNMFKDELNHKNHVISLSLQFLVPLMPVNRCPHRNLPHLHCNKASIPPYKINKNLSLMGFLHFLVIPIFLAVVVDCGTETNPLGPVTNVTKHLSFPNFDPNKNPRIHHDLKLLGNAKLSPQNGIIQIPDTQTQDLKFQAGRVIYSSPIRLFDPHTQTPASFTTTFSFQINTNTTTASDAGQTQGGSGLTFIIVPDELTVGRPGPWLGMLNDICDNNYKAVAVEFDTRRNIEFGDPNDNHVGINLGSIVSTTTINASDAGVFFKDGSIHRAWISYNGPNRWIEIRLGSDGQDYPIKPLFSSPLDLSNFLREYMFVGFSASTGNLTQIHNIISWNFSSASEARLRLPSTETCERKLVSLSNTVRRKPTNAFLVFIAVVILCLVVVLNLYCNSKRRENSSLVPLPDNKRRPRPPNKPRRFAILEISSATRGFSEEEVLGSDLKGIFYRGSLPNGCHVAIKRLSTQFLNSAGVDRLRFLKEISRVSRVRHPNLVPIRGWCCDRRETIVIYEYFSNGSLDKWLFARGVLQWSRRFKVLKDVAEGLCFLHGKKLAHKNVKTSSVFLNVSFRAVLGDFGLAFSRADSNWVESVLGQKADVFEFGMMAMEIVAGRRRREWDSESGKEEIDLLDIVWRMREEEQLVKVVDRRMRTIFNSVQAIRVLEIGLLCTVNEAKARPSMEEVVEFLNMEKAIPELPQSRPVALFPYNSTTDLCSFSSCVLFK